ncbi:DUF362 domain-containing protein [Candidatus Lucifugimonas marina]|jgi:uncharacterized protein (DUF362 family)|uniref:DUF362 domain-containing protein n=1 Tax=Candidatus Lucifugimonas marina TaxID=3038979 RepID=A0AAJ5ZDT7_9CHLR|nr:DUF362 domain-containing protein [SAR202 cluster bacterium JH702]MDG0868827.1 DUF362 domain-containing protein [SAR202 cluster bacterium JH639]WFG35456.1 DUF362 domain-containing protein [SAR202 cluster bacterium JH545]WFG39403.1 DUF362 domain-containing protein [SAR202 cluster bacterium JH1073]
MIKVSIASSDSRDAGVTRSLELIDSEVDIPDRPVMVKPNFVTTSNQLAATHVDSTRATLEYLAGKGVTEFVIAVGPAIGTPDSGFDNYGYRDLANDFNIEFMDLNTDDRIPVPAFDDHLNPQTLYMSKRLSESYVVSVCPMKTHNNVVVTLGLKNILVGTLSGVEEKRKIHKGSKAINLTLAKMAQHVVPDLTVIDGVVGMQGNGPIDGFEMPSNVVVASHHGIAADVVGLQVMGYSLDQVGYLRYAMELRNLGVDDIQVVGETIDDAKVSYADHKDIEEQLTWPLQDDWHGVFDRD